MDDQPGRTMVNRIIEGSGRSVELSHSFTCVPLTADDCDQTSRVYTDVFLRDEPTSCRHAPDPVVFLPYARFYIEFCMRKQLSFIARDEENQDVIGFILCSDLATDWNAEGKNITAFLSHFYETIAVLDELEMRFFDRNKILPGTVLHVFQLGVMREFRGLSVSTTLIRLILTHAREWGFSRVIADCTSPASCRSFERCGFYEAEWVSYDLIRINGSGFFTGLDGGISLMVRDL